MRFALRTKTRGELRAEKDGDPVTRMARSAFNAFRDSSENKSLPRASPDETVIERTWEISADAKSIAVMQREQPKRYAAFQVGITLVTWALRPDDFMERLRDAALPVAVDNDFADALLTMFGVAFDEMKQKEE